MPRTSRAKASTVVDDMPLAERLCRGFTRHHWEFSQNKARKVGRYWLVLMPCTQCHKVTSILMDTQGNQMRGRGYVDPEGWTRDRWLNTVQGRAAMRRSLIPNLNVEE